MTTTISPEGIAQALNAHHRKTGAGFYAMGRHYFAARAIEGRLEVYDFAKWQTVPADKMKFHDHRSLEISLFE